MFIGESQMGRDEWMHGRCVSFQGTSLEFFFLNGGKINLVWIFSLCCSYDSIVLSSASFACVDIEFYHLMPGNCYSPNAPLGTQTRWPPSFCFTKISSISAFHSSNSPFHSAEMSSIPTLNSPPLLVILSFSFGSNSCLWLTSGWEMKPRLRAMTSTPSPAGARSHLRGKTIKTSQGPTSGAVSYRASHFPPFLTAGAFFFFPCPSVSHSHCKQHSQEQNPLTLVCSSRVCVWVCVFWSQEPGLAVSSEVNTHPDSQ